MISPEIKELFNIPFTEWTEEQLDKYQGELVKILIPHIPDGSRFIMSVVRLDHPYDKIPIVIPDETPFPLVVQILRDMADNIEEGMSPDDFDTLEE